MLLLTRKTATTTNLSTHSRKMINDPVLHYIPAAARQCTRTTYSSLDWFLVVNEHRSIATVSLNTLVNTCFLFYIVPFLSVFCYHFHDNVVSVCPQHMPVSCQHKPGNPILRKRVSFGVVTLRNMRMPMWEDNIKVD